MKKIYYWDKLGHYKTFVPFANVSKDDIILSPVGFCDISGLWRNLKYKSQDEVKNIISKEKPDVFVQSRNKGDLHKFLGSYSIKKIMIGHGVFTNSEYVAGLIKSSNNVYASFDKICVATEMFDRKPLLKNTTVNKNNVIATGLSQFDCLYDIIAKNRFKCTDQMYDKNVLLVGGHAIRRIGKTLDYVPRDEHYKCVFDVAKICIKNNWRLWIKPRSNYLSFLHKNVSALKWAKKYINEYKLLLKHNNITMLDADTNIYEYFNADLAILDGWSTAELEMCLAKIPMIIFNSSDLNDYLGTVKINAAMLISDIEKIESSINNVIGRKNELMNNQNKFIENIGVKFDGNSHNRILDVIRHA